MKKFSEETRNLFVKMNNRGKKKKKRRRNVLEVSRAAGHFNGRVELREEE